MATYFGIGFSKNTTPSEAALEAASIAKAQLKNLKPNGVIAFCTAQYDPKFFLPVIRETFPDTKILGCSSAGLILSDQIAARGISVLAIASDEIQFGAACLPYEESQDNRASGMALAKSAIADLGHHARHAFIFFPDGLSQNNALLLKGVQEIFGNGFPVVGAGSCDDFHFKKSYQFLDRQILTNGTCGVLLGGHMNISTASKHGWRPLGKPRYLTHTDGHIIRTIDGAKASSLYEEFLGEDVHTLHQSNLGTLAILYPLGIYMEDERDYLLRNVVKILPDGSIVCQDDVPQGAEVHLMIGNKESCRQAAVDTANEVKNNLFGRKPRLILIFESLVRHKLLGRMSFHEIKSIKSILGNDVPIFGMYSNGEMAPFKSLSQVQKNHLQNESIVIVAIS